MKGTRVAIAASVLGLIALSGAAEESSGASAIQQLNLVSAAKNGDLHLVKTLLAETENLDIDQKSEALMSAVWGALHTSSSQSFNFRNGQLQIFESIKRTSSVPRERFVEIITILLEAGAKTDQFKFETFSSVAVKKHLERKRKADALANSGSYTSISTFGGAPSTKVYLVPFGEDGLTVLEVAEIEEATDILEVLSENK